MPTATTSSTAKPRMLVVDDEPDNLDLLYRTFRRDFQVLKAESGQEALQKLSEEGEVAVIISDQRMPEMKGTEFLSKTLPEFPDTMRIILTGFTDVEDLVEAINAGQVYRYITKPWEPEELKTVVRRAADTYDLLKQRTQELAQVQLEAQLMHAITAAAQTQDSVPAMLSQVVSAFATAFDADGGEIQPVAAGTLTGEPVRAGDLPPMEGFPSLIEQALTAKAPQFLTAANQPPTSGVNGVAQPVLYHAQPVALIWLQWREPQPLSAMQQQVLALGADHLAVACHSLTPATS